MDILNKVTEDLVCGHITKCVIAAITAANISDTCKLVYYSAPPKTDDLPEDYVYYAYTELSPQKHTLAPKWYKRHVNAFVEINVATEHFDIGRTIRNAVEKVFLKGFDQYSIIVDDVKTTGVNTVQGMRLTVSADINFIYS